MGMNDFSIIHRSMMLYYNNQMNLISNRSNDLSNVESTE